MKEKELKLKEKELKLKEKELKLKKKELKIKENETELKEKDTKTKGTKSIKIKAEEDSNNNVENKMKDGVKHYLEKAKLKEEIIIEDDKEKSLSKEGIYSFYHYIFEYTNPGF